jgi:membrane protein implicated in regulation of membrane protease activity
MMGDGKTDSDQPLLNQRAAQLVGRNATLHEAIVDGSGRIKIGDTIWRVSGPDLPAGAKVTVSAIDGSSLVVSAI